MKPMHEQYRPAAWSDVVGQAKALAKVEALRRRGLGGRAYWITGASGSGKTTIGRLLASELADPMNIEEIDATTLTPAALQRIEASMQFYGMGAKKAGRAYLVNEAHGLRKDTVRQLLVLIERLPCHVVLVFTTTYDGENTLFEDCDDANPLLSRCVVLTLARRDVTAPMAERLKACAEREGLDGQPIDAYVKLLRKHSNNMRAAFQDVEAGAMIDAK